MIDAALGVVEKGWYHNDDAYHTQPFLPDGLVPHVVTWQREGYTPAGDPTAMVEEDTGEGISLTHT